jgi:hypothetical protein
MGVMMAAMICGIRVESQISKGTSALMNKKTIKGLVVSSVLWLAVSCVPQIWTRSGGHHRVSTGSLLGVRRHAEGPGGAVEARRTGLQEHSSVQGPRVAVAAGDVFHRGFAWSQL